MATSNEPLQLNLGSLRSAMSLTLHTHHASRIWHGRAAAEGRPGIGAMGVDRLSEAPRFVLEEARAVGADVMHRWRRA